VRPPVRIDGREPRYAGRCDSRVVHGDDGAGQTGPVVPGSLRLERR
jgi:hypothetical protein